MESSSRAIRPDAERRVSTASSDDAQFGYDFVGGQFCGVGVVDRRARWVTSSWPGDERLSPRGSGRTADSFPDTTSPWDQWSRGGRPLRGSGEVCSAIDDDRLAVDVDAVVGHQEGHHRGQVLRDAETGRTHRREDLLPPLLGGGRERRTGEDDARRDDVGADPVLAPQRRRVTREADKPALGGRSVWPNVARR